MDWRNISSCWRKSKDVWQMFGAWTKRLHMTVKQRVDPPGMLPNG